MRYLIPMHFHMIDARIWFLVFLWCLWTLEIVSGIAIESVLLSATRAENSDTFWMIIIIQAAVLATLTIFLTWNLLHSP